MTAFGEGQHRFMELLPVFQSREAAFPIQGSGLQRPKTS
jgi:hypothetical protein